MPNNSEPGAYTRSLVFEDNHLAALLYGEHNRNLDLIAESCGIDLRSRGNEVGLSGAQTAVDKAADILGSLWARVVDTQSLTHADVKAALTFANDTQTDKPLERFNNPKAMIKTKKKEIRPRTPAQGHYIDLMKKNHLVFALGAAGTGKTYLAVVQAVSMLESGQIDRIILTRPAVEAGERLGFLPGDLKEKIDPYLRPLYDALHDVLPADIVQKKLVNGEIEIAPLAFMRGRTLNNACVILDEGQNTTSMQMRMFLTRLGERAWMVVTGDPTQTDLPKGHISGLREAVSVLSSVDGVAIARFSDKDVVRHPLVSRIVKAYEVYEDS